MRRSTRKTANRQRIVVRAAKESDAKELGTFLMRAWREAGPGAPGFTGASEEAVKEISSEKFLIGTLADPKAKMLIAIADSGVVGFASLRAGRSRSAELSGIVVLQSASGLGIGTRLIRKSLALATRLGFRNISVQTEVFNKRAIGFYEENGFVEAGRRTEKVGEARVVLQVLRKTLT